MTVNTQKECRACKSLKCASQFKKHQARCIDCCKEKAALYRSTPEFKARKAKTDAARWLRDKERLSAANKEWRTNNPERVKEVKRIWVAENHDLVRAAKRRDREKNASNISLRILAWRQASPEKSKASSAMWNLRNPDLAKANQKRYYQNNKATFIAINSKRRAQELMATPAWANKKAILEFYKSAQCLNMLLGEWHYVDHIVPLRSKIVCGLHCEANLQILPAAENLKKKNFFWPDMPERESHMKKQTMTSFGGFFIAKSESEYL